MRKFFRSFLYVVLLQFFYGTSVSAFHALVPVDSDLRN